jgi:hypothetical protein
MSKVSVKDCCGVLEVSYVSAHTSPEDALKHIRPQIMQYVERSEPKPFAFFTGVIKRHGVQVPYNYGQALADFIQKHNLGTITVSPEGVNWTGNTLKIWIWNIDYDAWERYHKETEKAVTEQPEEHLQYGPYDIHTHTSVIHTLTPLHSREDPF